MSEPSTASPDPERERQSPTMRARWQILFPGLSVTVLIALASAFLSEHYGAPAMLLAILIGLALHFLAEDPKTAAGLDFASRTVLRTGIALLGLRVSVAMFAELGAAVIAMIVGAVLFTIAFGILASRLSGQGTPFGVLTGGAVAICGASAALAISATLGNRSKEAVSPCLHLWYWWQRSPSEALSPAIASDRHCCRASWWPFCCLPL